jgi:excisionase family DNA binding protein
MKPFLSPRQLAKAIGLSESSLKRWADDGRIAAVRTGGGHRRIARPEAIRFIRDSRLTVVRPDLLGLPEADVVLPEQGSEDALAEALFRALLHGDRDRAFGLLQSAFLAGRPLAWIFDGPVRSAMHRIGEIWQHRRDGIAVEHRATDLCIQAAMQLRLSLPAEDAMAPVAVGGAPSGDPYLLPSLMAAAVLQETGLRAINLGPDTPLASLEQAAWQHDAAVVWLSLSAGEAAEAVRRDLPRLAGPLAERGVELIVGGREIERLAGLRQANVALAHRMAELAAFARGLLARGGGASAGGRDAEPRAT